MIAIQICLSYLLLLNIQSQDMLWQNHLPMPMAIAPDLFTSVELKRLLRQVELENAAVRQYTPCGLVIKPLAKEKSPYGTRQRTVLLILDKSSGGASGSGSSSSSDGGEIAMPGSNIDLAFLHEQFFNWGRFGSKFFVEPQALLHFNMTSVTMLKPMPRSMEMRHTRHFVDADWYAKALPVRAPFNLLTEKFAVRIDYADELMRELTQRAVRRYLLAKAAAQK